MNPTPRPPGNDDARTAVPPHSGIRQTLRELADTLSIIGWRFFDWLAVVSWKKLLLVSALALILAGILKHPIPALMLIIGSFIVKVAAGGKRRADLTASEATKRAETEQLERTVAEARMEALQAQIEPHFLFNTLASIDQLIQTDPKRASDMQKSLIRYLRSAMPQMRDGGRPTWKIAPSKITSRPGLGLAQNMASPDASKNIVSPPHSGSQCVDRYQSAVSCRWSGRQSTCV